ncbi:MAG: trimethylamine methyltransferase family protein [Anaerolineae bacterium]
MGTVSGKISVLSQEDMQALHDTAVRILAEVGMRIDHAEALAYLDGAGCKVDKGNCHVLFPPDVVNKAAERMRQQFARPARYRERIPMRYTAMYFSTFPRRPRPSFDVNTGGFPPHVLTLERQRRYANMQDVRDSIRLADALPNIDMVGLPCSAQEVPPKLRPVVMAAELVKHTAKIGGIEAWTPKDIEYLTRIGEVVRGSAEELGRRPLLVGYGEAKSPLVLDENMAAVFVAYVKAGVPQSLDTMPAGGTTAPASSAGTLALGLAETLGALVLAYAIDEDAVISLDVCPTLTAMESMIYPYAGADRIPLVTAAMQMLADFYCRPGGCHGGKTDACMPGAQAGMEKALSIIFPVLAGATGVGTLGHVENAVTFSFEQLVIDDAIAGYIRRMLKGFEVKEETLAFDVIKEVGIGGNFLQHPHTATHFREEFYLPDIVERLPWAAWEGQEVRGMEAKAREKAKHLLAEHWPKPLDSAQEREVDAIVEAARKDPAYA